jgi:hypothetical protein
MTMLQRLFVLILLPRMQNMQNGTSRRLGSSSYFEKFFTVTTIAREYCTRKGKHMYDHDHETAYDRELAAMTDEKASELRRFLDAADAALKRDGLSHHPRPKSLELLRDFLEERDRRRRPRVLH